MHFHYPKDKHNFEELLEQFKSKSNAAKLNETDSTELNLYRNSLGEKSKRDQLIVMDYVSGQADSSKKLESFLTVARKFNYHCAYIFHILYPEKKIWKSIISQTNIFNFFPASVLLGNV